MDCEKSVSNTQNQYSFTGTGKVHICHSPWPEHGLLHHQIGPWFIQNMHHDFSVGKVLLPMTTNGHHMLSRRLPSQDVRADGHPWVRLSVHRRSLVYHKGQPGWSPLKAEKSTHQAQMTGLKVNEAKCSFCATETEYLGYVLTREASSHNQKR